MRERGYSSRAREHWNTQASAAARARVRLLGSGKISTGAADSGDGRKSGKKRDRGTEQLGWRPGKNDDSVPRDMLDTRLLGSVDMHR